MNWESVERLEDEGALERDDSSMEDVAGTPTWPIPSAGLPPDRAAPPVGLNWSRIAGRFGVPEEVLRHDGSIVLTGEYFPEAGYAIDGETLEVNAVDINVAAPRPAYFVGRLTASEFGLRLSPAGSLSSPRRSRPASNSTVIGLFASENLADRARKDILRSALGTDITVERGPLGIELRVQTAESGGRAATVIAQNGGAVISVGGQPILPGS